MKKACIMLAGWAIIGATLLFPRSATPNEGPLLGEIRLFAGKTPPRGWTLCDGRSLTIERHRELFALIGTSFGGDGKTTFALPDLREKIPGALSRDKTARPLYRSPSNKAWASKRGAAVRKRAGEKAVSGEQAPLNYIIAMYTH